MFVLQLTWPEARKANNCSRARESPAAGFQAKSTGLNPQSAELQLRPESPKPEQLFLCSARLPRRNPDSAQSTKSRRSQNPNNSSCLLQPAHPQPESAARNPNILARPPGASTQKGPNPKARPLKPEQNPMPAARKPDSRPRKSSTHPENGVICPIMGLFAIFRYIYNLFCSWCYVLHSTLRHSLEFRKFLKHLLPTHLSYVLMHDMAFIYQ